MFRSRYPGETEGILVNADPPLAKIQSTITSPPTYPPEKVHGSAALVTTSRNIAADDDVEIQVDCIHRGELNSGTKLLKSMSIAFRESFRSFLGDTDV